MVATSREPRGRFSLDGQKRNQLPETDSQLPFLDLRNWRLAADSVPGTLRLENSLGFGAYFSLSVHHFKVVRPNSASGLLFPVPGLPALRAADLLKARC